MNLDFINTEVLVVQQQKQVDCYTVVGISYGNALTVDARYKTVRASRFAIDMVKNALKAGKVVKIPVKTEGPEIRPVDIIIAEPGDELTVEKRVLLNEISMAIGQNALGASVIDMFDFMTAFSKLADYGIFITDENRDEKYFEVIDKAQQVEAPADLPDGASYADEQEYLEKKRKYAFAQSSLQALEHYLIAYDKIKIMYSFDKKLKELTAEIDAASSPEELKPIREKFNSLVGRMFTPVK